MMLKSKKAKLIFAVALIILAGGLTVWRLNSGRLDKAAERLIRSTISGDCSSVLQFLTQEEKDATGLSEQEMCAFLNDAVFPALQDASIVGVNYRKNASDAGTTALHETLQDGSSVVLKQTVYRTGQHPCTSLHGIFKMVYECQAASDKRDPSKFLEYAHIYQDRMQTKAVAHKLQKIYESTGQFKLMEIEAYFKYWKLTNYVTAISDKPENQGLSITELNEVLASDPIYQGMLGR